MILVDATHAVMEPSDFDELGEYSLTLPTGTTAGKRWKRNTTVRWHYDAAAPGYNPDGPWVMGEYGEPRAAAPGTIEARDGREVVPIFWREIVVVGG